MSAFMFFFLLAVHVQYSISFTDFSLQKYIEEKRELKSWRSDSRREKEVQRALGEDERIDV